MPLPRSLRDITPKGLYWRTLLIIGLPIVLMQIVVTAVFLDDHWRAISKRMSQLVASDIGLLVELYERDPSPSAFADVQALARERLRLDISLEAGAQVAKPRCGGSFSVVDRYFRTFLEDALARQVWLDPTCPGETVEIRVPVEQGALRIIALRDRVQAESGPWFVAWVIGATILFVTISILFVRNQVRPIEQLADAMQRFGRGEEVSLYSARGAREVRAATLAFFNMRARIRRHIEQRGQLLAGVSHDLRTPITRLKLQLALMPKSEEVEDAKRDVKDLEDTLEEYLAFARGALGEEPQPTDLAELVADVVAKSARTGANVSVRHEGDLTATVRASALRRALVNLIDNAVSHGQAVEVLARREAQAITLMIDDDGPGIAEEHYEDAFRPFSRLDATRTRNAKGVGLGLAIARDAARAHGGDISLARSPLGGLRAILRLPAPALAG